MSVSTSIPQTARRGRAHRLGIVSALTAVIVAAAWAIATYPAGPGSRTANHPTSAQASVLAGLTPQERRYVLGIVSLTPAQLGAAFGTNEPSGGRSGPASLTPRERRYAQAIASMTRSQQAAAFGTGK